MQARNRLFKSSAAVYRWSGEIWRSSESERTDPRSFTLFRVILDFLSVFTEVVAVNTNSLFITVAGFPFHKHHFGEPVSPKWHGIDDGPPLKFSEWKRRTTVEIRRDHEDQLFQRDSFSTTVGFKVCTTAHFGFHTSAKSFLNIPNWTRRDLQLKNHPAHSPLRDQITLHEGHLDDSTVGRSWVCPVSLCRLECTGWFFLNIPLSWQRNNLDVFLLRDHGPEMKNK